MAWNVHIHVAFECGENDPVAALARTHLPQTEVVAATEQSWESVVFLQHLSERTGSNPGPKGGLSLWGMVGNHTRAEAFAEVLRPFWNDLLRSNFPAGPASFTHILVFYEEEQAGMASALEIYLEGPQYDDTDRFDLSQCELVIKKHEALPFAWIQY